MAVSTARNVIGLLGRFGKANREYSVQFTPLTTLQSPGSIRTDKIISFLLIEFKGRITTGATAFTPLPDALRNLIQEIRIYGSHSVFGEQTPVKIRAYTQNLINKVYRFAYTPRDKILKAGASGTFDGAASTAYDVQVFWTVPLFPLPMSLSLAPLYSLKGPDWAGNLYVDLDTADGTALGTTAANITFSAYGVTTGNPTVYVSTVHPKVTVDLMNSISPALPFRSYKLADAVVQGSSFTDNKIVDLNIGKRTVSVHNVAGMLASGLSPSVRAYSSLSDGILTRMMVSLDGKELVTPYDGITQQEEDSWLGGQVLQTGVYVYNFERETGNPDSAFPSETLTSARRFQLFGDVTAAAQQGDEVVQDEILGSPQGA
jgi:hypothetical protein